MHSFGFHDNVYCHLSASLCAGFIAVSARGQRGASLSVQEASRHSVLQAARASCKAAHAAWRSWAQPALAAHARHGMACTRCTPAGPGGQPV